MHCKMATKIFNKSVSACLLIVHYGHIVNFKNNRSIALLGVKVTGGLELEFMVTIMAALPMLAMLIKISLSK